MSHRLEKISHPYPIPFWLLPLLFCLTAHGEDPGTLANRAARIMKGYRGVADSQINTLRQQISSVPAGSPDANALRSQLQTLEAQKTATDQAAKAADAAQASATAGDNSKARGVTSDSTSSDSSASASASSAAASATPNTNSNSLLKEIDIAGRQAIENSDSQSSDPGNQLATSQQIDATRIIEYQTIALAAQTAISKTPNTKPQTASKPATPARVSTIKDQIATFQGFKKTGDTGVPDLPGGVAKATASGLPSGALLSTSTSNYSDSTSSGHGHSGNGFAADTVAASTSSPSDTGNGTTATSTSDTGSGSATSDSKSSGKTSFSPDDGSTAFRGIRAIRASTRR